MGKTSNRSYQYKHNCLPVYCFVFVVCHLVWPNEWVMKKRFLFGVFFSVLFRFALAHQICQVTFSHWKGNDAKNFSIFACCRKDMSPLIWLVFWCFGAKYMGILEFTDKMRKLVELPHIMLQLHDFGNCSIST